MRRGGLIRGRSQYWRRPAAPTVRTSPLGNLIATITKEDLLSDCTDAKYATISDVRPVASYNWVDSSVDSSSKPPKWTPLAVPEQLQPDGGDYYRDLNAASIPDHPLEPAVVSVITMCPSPMQIDVVACGSTIGNLRRFAAGKDLDYAFRMTVEMVGDTIHLIRKESDPKELIPDVRGYGHTFPEAYTTWDRDISQSKSHQRILKYRFADLDMLVRFEGDGYIDTEDGEKSESTSKRTDDHDPTVSQEPDALAFRPFEPDSRLTVSKLQTANGGRLVPQQAIFDLKTRSVYNQQQDTLDKQLPRLWISQVEQFILGRHKRGVFEDIKVMQVKDKVKQWEQDNQPSLFRLAALLRLIITRVKESHDERLEIFLATGEALEIRESLPASTAVLSQAVRAHWSDWLAKGRDETFEVNKDSEDESYHGSDEDSLARDDSDDDSRDYTACDSECGYCGRC